MRNAIAAVGLLLGLVTSPASAVDIDWEFNGVFSAGFNPAISGTFRYDMASNMLTEIDLAVDISSDVFTENAGTVSNAIFTQFLGNLEGRVGLFFLNIDLSDQGNLNPVVNGNNVRLEVCTSPTCDQSDVVGVLQEGSLVGTLPAIPLPAGLPLLAGGLAAFGVLRHLRKRSKRLLWQACLEFNRE